MAESSPIKWFFSYKSKYKG